MVNAGNAHLAQACLMIHHVSFTGDEPFGIRGGARSTSSPTGTGDLEFIGSRVDSKDSAVQEVAVCPRTTQRVAVRLEGCREVGSKFYSEVSQVLIYERPTCGLAGWSHRELGAH